MAQFTLCSMSGHFWELDSKKNSDHFWKKLTWLKWSIWSLLSRGIFIFTKLFIVKKYSVIIKRVSTHGLYPLPFSNCVHKQQIHAHQNMIARMFFVTDAHVFYFELISSGKKHSLVTAHFAIELAYTGTFNTDFFSQSIASQHFK